MSTPYTGKRLMHKHRELIIAWANGAQIQEYIPTLDEWRDCSEYPVWDERREYRIKPELKHESKKVTMYIYNNMIDGKTWIDEHPNEMLYPEWKYMGSIEVLK